MEGKAEADYAACVDICTFGAEKMIMPAAIAIVSPIIVGLLLGPNGVAGMLAGATVTGFLLAVMMANAGGAWDNARSISRRARITEKARTTTRPQSSAIPSATRLRTPRAPQSTSLSSCFRWFPSCLPRLFSQTISRCNQI